MLAGMSDEPAPATPSTPSWGEPTTQQARPWAALLTAGALGVALGAGGVAAAWSMSTGPAAKPQPAVASASAQAGSFTLVGSLTLAGFGHWTSGGVSGCAGTGGYSDIGSGASVTVYDGSGQVVAVGALSSGSLTGSSCEFAVTVPNVPDGTRFYQVEISHRGKITLSNSDAKTGHFAASLG